MPVPALCGSDLATAAFSDLESFFFHSSKFRVRREFNTNISSAAKIAGVGENTRIRFSRDFCEFANTSLADYFFSLLIVSHELAHYLNSHNEHTDQNREETFALEARADNFGAMIFLTIITFGESTNKNMLKIDANVDQRILAENMGTALGRMYLELFVPNQHPNYPSPSHRAFSIMAGFLSFFNRLFGHLPEDWSTWFLLTCLRRSNLLEHVNADDAMRDSKEIVERIFEIHQKLQIQQPIMRHGAKPRFGLFLYSNFQQSRADRDKHEARLVAMVERFNLFRSTEVPKEG